MISRRHRPAKGAHAAGPRAVRALAPVLALVILAGCTRAPTGPPDIVLITLDTTRADKLRPYDDDSPATPHIAKLASRGAVFTRAYSPASVTPVAHASILTGLYPYRHGLRVMHGTRGTRLPEEAQTLAEILGQAGYRTAAFISAFPAGPRFGLAQGFDVFDAEFSAATGTNARPPLDRDGQVSTGLHQRGAAETTTRALAWLTGAPEDDRPRFVWVHYFDPHDALVVPPDAFLSDYDIPQRPARAYLSAMYDAEVTYMDRELGRLLDALDPSHTVVAITADHGEALGEHDWWTHGLLYEEQIRVPLILAGPGIARARVDRVVRTIDVMPTVLELAGGSGSELDLDGRSLLEVEDDPPRSAYADSLSTSTYNVWPEVSDAKMDRLVTLVEQDWKYIHHHTETGASELYHLGDDPDEQNDLSRKRRDVVRRMRTQLGRRLHVPDWVRRPGTMSAEDRKRLEALGYIQ